MATDSDDASIITLLEGMVDDPYELGILKMILSNQNNPDIIEAMIILKEGEKNAEN